MNDHWTGIDAARTASVLDPDARAATFKALRPALEALSSEADADPRLSTDARRTLRAVARTRPEGKLTLADLAARGSTPKARVPAALNELNLHGYLTRLANIAPHLAAALPAQITPEPASAHGIDGGHDKRPRRKRPRDATPARSTEENPPATGATGHLASFAC